MNVALFILGLVLALAVAWALMVCLLWLAFVQVASMTLQSAAKEKAKHGK